MHASIESGRAQRCDPRTISRLVGKPRPASQARAGACACACIVHERGTVSVRVDHLVPFERQHPSLCARVVDLTKRLYVEAPVCRDIQPVCYHNIQAVHGWLTSRPPVCHKALCRDSLPRSQRKPGSASPPVTGRGRTDRSHRVVARAARSGCGAECSGHSQRLQTTLRSQPHAASQLARPPTERPAACRARAECQAGGAYPSVAGGPTKTANNFA
eukprot:scaffold44343_cov55-Phaeocystis_antarctica.AAC.1